MGDSGRLVVIVLGVALTLLVSSAAPTAHAGETVVKPKSELTWTAGAVPGVSSAVVSGDMAKGPSHFYLKYAAGFVTPPHHHSADHYVTTVAGTLVLSVAGKEHRLAPGSYFALTGGAKHVARCEGSEDCVMFIDARGAWDIVPEAKAEPKH